MYCKGKVQYTELLAKPFIDTNIISYCIKIL